MPRTATGKILHRVLRQRYETHYVLKPEAGVEATH